MSILSWVILILLFYLIFEVLKGLVIPSRPKRRFSPRDQPETSDQEEMEELVRDALTGEYFPRSEGVASMVGEKVLYFMNVENRDRYLARLYKR